MDYLNTQSFKIVFFDVFSIKKKSKFLLPLHHKIIVICNLSYIQYLIGIDKLPNIHDLIGIEFNCLKSKIK